MNEIEHLHQVRIAAAFEGLSLAELQLLLLGLWIIGEENRVDPTMSVQYGWLLHALGERAALRINAPIAGGTLLPVSHAHGYVEKIKGDATI